jgi:hypothetical protein
MNLGFLNNILGMDLTAVGRYPNALFGLTVLYSLRQTSFMICASSSAKSSIHHSHILILAISLPALFVAL